MRKLAILLAVTASTNLYAAITGTVLDPDTKPIAGATIRAFAPESSLAMRARIVAGKIDRDPIASAKSAENGTFSLDVKDAIAVDVVVDAPPHPRISIATVDGDDLGAILLAPPAPRMLRVTSGGKPVVNAIVVAGTEISRTNAAGEVPAPASNSVYVFHPDYAIARRDPANSFEMKLVRGVAVSGRVTNPAGPVAHAVVSINGWPLAESGDDGAFTIAHAPERWQSISAIRGSEAGMVMRPKTGAPEIRITPGATFAGTLRDTGRGGAVAAARMTITAITGDESMTTATDAKGAFTFGPLLPHTYQIAGVHPSYTIESSLVTLPATRTRAFAAQAFARAKGRVIDEDRKAVAAAVVTANSINTTRGRSAVTTANGEFAVRVIPSGTPPFPMSLLATKRDYVAASSAARNWKAGEVKDDVVITLAHGFVAQMRVVDKQKQPVPNAQVSVSKLSDQGMQRSTTVACADSSKTDCHRTGADGIVSIRTTEGRHDLRVSGDDIGPFHLPNQLITARAASVVVTVDRGITVSGRVVRPDGTPVSAAVVDAPTIFAPRTTDTNSDGTFTLTGLASGPAVLTAHSIDGNLSSPPVTVTAPAKDITLTIPRGARIEGRVLDRATQQPVTDFAVSLPSRSQRPFVDPTPHEDKTIHADDGSYAIDNVPPGAVNLTVRASGYVTGSRGDINAEDGKTVTGIDIQLDRGATISGHVTSHGAAVAGADVRQAAQRMLQPGPQTGVSVTTDADGLYKLDGIAEGDRLIEFHKTGFITAQKPVAVKGGKDVQLDADLDPGHELRGRVVDRSGRGVAGAYINATGAGDRRFDSMIVSDADGSFVVPGLADGKYQVTARREGMVSGDASDVDLPQTRPLSLTLDAGATITGRITGIPAEELTQVAVTAVGGTSRNQTYADAGGNFSLPGLPDGQVRVDAFLVTAGHRRMAPAKTIVVENGVAPAVEINFEEGISVSGRVTKGGLPVSFGSVAFSPSGARPGGDRQYVNAMISPDGTYTAAGLSIGDYTVRVNGPNVSQYQTKYTASTSGTFDIDIHGATLRGRVVDARTGAPVADARVLLMSRLPANGSAHTDSDGRFAIEAMPDATYDLQVNREQYAVASQPVVIANGSTPDVEVRLEQVPAITIHVTDSTTGAPVDVTVMISDSSRAFRGEIARVEPGTWRAWLKPGTYSASVGGSGYVFKSQSFTTPGDDVTIQVVRAGTLLIRAGTAQRARLDFSSGGTQRNFGPLHPGPNGPFESIPPGSYMLTLLGSDGKVAQSIAVVINAGQTTTIDTP